MPVFLTVLAVAGGLVALGTIVLAGWKIARFLVRLADLLFGDGDRRLGLGDRVGQLETAQRGTNERLETTNARIDDLTRVVMDGH